MSFYNNQYNMNFTFQRHTRPPNLIPPPPVPPPFYIPNVPTTVIDQDIIKQFESKLPKHKNKEIKVNTMSISTARDSIRDLLLKVEQLKQSEKELSENIESFTDEEWKLKLSKIEGTKELINDSMSKINNLYINILKKLLAKRTAKRLRLKRQKEEKRKEKEKKIKEMEERSRKIDENLQSIKDSIHKAQQEEEAKLKADAVLKEVLRKKHDAKKCVTKLEALQRLHVARRNTAKGRGENVSDAIFKEFDTKIDNLKSMWALKVIAYEKEEVEMRNKLMEDVSQDAKVNDGEHEIEDNLAAWSMALFGARDVTPQASFDGDLARFVAVRHQWDQFLSEDGTPLPVGWVNLSKPNN